jgi:hypothetical protein
LICFVKKYDFVRKNWLFMKLAMTQWAAMLPAVMWNSKREDEVEVWGSLYGFYSEPKGLRYNYAVDFETILMLVLMKMGSMENGGE